MTKIPSDDIMESLNKLRMRESAQLKTVLELCDMEIHQKISMPNYQKLKTMVKRNINQKLRLRNFDARRGRFETGAVVKSHRGLSGAERRQGVCNQWKATGGSVRRESNASGTKVMSVQNRPPKPLSLLNHQHQEVEVRREKRASEPGVRPSGETNRPPCKHFLKGTCTKSLCENWHPPECRFYKTRSGCGFGAECSFPHWKVEEEPNKRPKKGGDKSAVATVKDVRQLGCVSQDAEPSESVAISRKGTQILGPIRRLRFPRATLRPANIR